MREGSTGGTHLGGLGDVLVEQRGSCFPAKSESLVARSSSASNTTHRVVEQHERRLVRTPSTRRVDPRLHRTAAVSRVRPVRLVGTGRVGSDCDSADDAGGRALEARRHLRV